MPKSHESNSNYAVIMAGGRGERFWPMSRFARPKQFIELFDNKPLLRHAVDRLAGLVPPERIIVVTSRDLVEASRATLPMLPPANIVGEPCGRDTAAACAFGTELVAARQGGDSATVAILTADHLMDKLEVYRQTLRDAYELAAKEPLIVTIGIPPTEPATVYGYIEAGDALATETPTAFMKARRFVEKPDLETATTYLQSGRHFWNSGMFVWSVATFRDALQKHRPALAKSIQELAPSIGAADFEERLDELYPKIERISIDYAVMEHADNIVMSKGEFDWDDVGAWPAAASHFPSDAHGNVAVGAAEMLEAKNNIVMTDSGHLVAVFGADDLVVVHTENATLVCPRDRVAELRDLVRRIKERPDGDIYT